MNLHDVPDGATLERSYLALARGYTIGPRFDNTRDGWAGAISLAETRRVDAYGRSWAGQLREETVAAADNASMIDLRWVLRLPDGTTVDTIAHRYTWAETAGRRAAAASSAATPATGPQQQDTEAEADDARVEQLDRVTRVLNEGWQLSGEQCRWLLAEVNRLRDGER